MRILVFILVISVFTFGQTPCEGTYTDSGSSTYTFVNMSTGTVEQSLGDDGDDSPLPSLPMWKCWADEKDGQWKCQEDAVLIMDTIQ